MSVAEVSSASEYQYNTTGNVRAPRQADGAIEVMLDVKLVQQNYATPDYLATLGGQAGEARAAGFVLGFQPASVLGIETLNELTGQWRPITANSMLAVVASLPE